MKNKNNKKTADITEREQRLFNALDADSKGKIFPQSIRNALTAMGIQMDDPRLKEVVRTIDAMRPNTTIGIEKFCETIRPSIGIVEKAIHGQMMISDFNAFKTEIEEIFHRTTENRDGDVADYIPQLGRVDPEQYGVSICTIDGQRLSLGDHDVDFCVQSASKPITYCLALEEHGEEMVHQYIGREPSGRGFNELTLNHEGRPHNPMINSGAIMSSSLIRADLHIADRFDYVMEQWKALAGGQKVGFSNSVYLSEKNTADRNFALGYFMQENKAFPESAHMIETLEFYFQLCSMELDANKMSVVAGTLANGGVCPITHKRIFCPRTVRNCLSLMYSCGMYDSSGEFAFTIGLPAKSGVAGALMIVVPNVMGICTWSPRLDKVGNSIRGIAFCKELVQTFNFHNYDILSGLSGKKDPRKKALNILSNTNAALTWAASKGDLQGIVQLESQGLPISAPDYDGRTPLHLAAAEGHLETVRFFVNRQVDLNPKDRWGGTPLEDAKKHGHEAVAQLLNSCSAG